MTHRDELKGALSGAERDEQTPAPSGPSEEQEQEQRAENNRGPDANPEVRVFALAHPARQRYQDPKVVTSANPGIRSPILRFFQPRAALLLTATAVGVALGARSAWGPHAARAQDEAGLAELLGKRANCQTGQIRWEPSGGMLLDWLAGRGVFFECKTADGPRDIYRARVRISPDGALLSSTKAWNLTATSEADESGLGVRGPFIAYTSSSSASLGVTVLERRRMPASVESALRSLIESGTPLGYQKTHFLFPEEIKAIRFELEGKVARVKIDAQTEPASIDLSAASTPAHLGFRVERQPIPKTPLAHLGADLLRSFLGPEPVARLERWLFRSQDLWKRTFHATPEPAPELPTSVPTPPFEPEPGSKQQVRSWPPADDALIWRPVEHGFLPRPRGAPLSYHAVTRPDPERPYVEAELVEFDMRYLELGIRAGYMEPKPETGPPEGGHVPEDPLAYQRIVATMNGGFQSVHGQFGMKSDGRLLVRPKPGYATVRVDEAGSVELGTWTEADRAEDFVSFRQNLEPLLLGGVFDPSGRGHFGDHLLHGGVFTERSGLCVNARKNLVFVWAKDIDPKGLAEAMRRAGCVYGMHLDMNPGHCSLSFHKVESFQPLRAQSVLLNREMKVNASRFLRWSPKDFFYLALASDAPTGERVSWSKVPSQGSSSLVYSAESKVGSDTVHLLQVSPRGAHFRLHPGKRDGGPNAPVPRGELRLGLGHRTHGSRPGLSQKERSLVPMHRAFATLEIRADGELRMHEPGVPFLAQKDADFVQLPVLLRDGVPTDRAKARGDTRSRVALCLGRSGALFLASSIQDSPSLLVSALRDLGCSLILEADRGSHFASSVTLGSEGGDLSEETVLLIERGELSPRARSFTSPSGAVASQPALAPRR